MKKLGIVSRTAGDVHGRAAIPIERERRARAVDGNLEMVGAAEERTELAARPVLEGDRIGGLKNVGEYKSA